MAVERAASLLSDPKKEDKLPESTSMRDKMRQHRTKHEQKPGIFHSSPNGV
jgi:hypothetical protein